MANDIANLPRLEFLKKRVEIANALFLKNLANHRYVYEQLLDIPDKSYLPNDSQFYLRSNRLTFSVGNFNTAIIANLHFEIQIDGTPYVNREIDEEYILDHYIPYYNIFLNLFKLLLQHFYHHQPYLPNDCTIFFPAHYEITLQAMYATIPNASESSANNLITPTTKKSSEFRKSQQDQVKNLEKLLNILRNNRNIKLPDLIGSDRKYYNENTKDLEPDFLNLIKTICLRQESASNLFLNFQIRFPFHNHSYDLTIRADFLSLSFVRNLSRIVVNQAIYYIKNENYATITQGFTGFGND
jgi:hypothetical protein